MAAREYDLEIAAIDATLVSIEKVLDLPKLRASAIELEAAAGVPDLWDDPENAQKVTSRLSRVQSTIGRLEGLRRRVEDMPILLELANAEEDESALADAGAELDSVKKAISELEVQTLLNGEYDERDALVTIRSEAGGVEAADWAEMLMRMYLRYCERHNLKVDVLETSYAEEAGIKSTTFRVSSPYAYGTLSVEQGTHRLVRISPFDIISDLCVLMNFWACVFLVVFAHVVLFVFLILLNGNKIHIVPYSHNIQRHYQYYP
jgi:peptide chain release factor 2